MTAPVVEVVVTADLAVKHNAISPGKLEDTITHTRHSLNSEDGESDLDRNEIGK